MKKSMDLETMRQAILKVKTNVKAGNPNIVLRYAVVIRPGKRNGQD